MRLTAFTDYGLRALMRLAGAPDRTFTVPEIAAEFDISRNHLMKVVRELTQQGFVQTQRGASGGIRLSRPAKDIRLGSVVRALEARHALVECFQKEGCACSLMPQCRLKKRLARAREAFLDDLDRTTLADCAYPGSPKRRRSPTLNGN